MIRAAFLSMGLYAVLCGAGLFFVEDIRLNEKAAQLESPVFQMVTSTNSNGNRVFNPPDWMPFTCIGVGGVTMLYAIALPRPE